MFRVYMFIVDMLTSSLYTYDVHIEFHIVHMFLVRFPFCVFTEFMFTSVL